MRIVPHTTLKIRMANVRKRVYAQYVVAMIYELPLRMVHDTTKYGVLHAPTRF